MKSLFYTTLEKNPIIAAIKNDVECDCCCKMENIELVFVLYGDVCNIKEIVKKLHDAKKKVMVHVDLIEGFSNKEIIVDFIKDYTLANGIISTKPAMIRRAKELSLYTVQRVFILDSMSYENIEKLVALSQPDCMEILPGLMPKIIKKIVQKINVPLVVGGLINDKEDVVAALEAGAICVSTTNSHVWQM